jgi:hypothetical protein
MPVNLSAAKINSEKKLLDDVLPFALEEDSKSPKL